LYATFVGAVLIVVGILGFFGLFADDAWDNGLHMAAGALGLLLAGAAPRAYAKWAGAAFTALAAWGFVVGDGGTILGLIPSYTGGNVLHLAVGLLGLGAAAASG